MRFLLRELRSRDPEFLAKCRRCGMVSLCLWSPRTRPWRTARWTCRTPRPSPRRRRPRAAAGRGLSQRLLTLLAVGGMSSCVAFCGPPEWCVGAPAPAHTVSSAHQSAASRKPPSTDIWAAATRGCAARRWHPHRQRTVGLVVRCRPTTSPLPA